MHMRCVSCVASSRLPANWPSLPFSRGLFTFLGAALSFAGERACLHLGQVVAAASAWPLCIRSVSRMGLIILVEVGRSGGLAGLRA